MGFVCVPGTFLLRRIKSLPGTRPSVVDPRVMKMMGPGATSKSVRDDRRAHVQKTYMVYRFHVNVLDRTKKPSKQTMASL